MLEYVVLIYSTLSSLVFMMPECIFSGRVDVERMGCKHALRASRLLYRRMPKAHTSMQHFIIPR